MLQNVTWLAIVAVHTAANELPKVAQPAAQPAAQRAAQPAGCTEAMPPQSEARLRLAGQLR